MISEKAIRNELQKLGAQYVGAQTSGDLLEASRLLTRMQELMLLLGARNVRTNQR